MEIGITKFGTHSYLEAPFRGIAGIGETLS